MDGIFHFDFVAGAGAETCVWAVELPDEWDLSHTYIDAFPSAHVFHIGPGGLVTTTADVVTSCPHFVCF